MDTPLITILIPSYNRADYIGAAIASVLHQTFPNWELLFLDDASTDETESIVADFIKKDARIHYIRQPENMGSTRNRNIGIEKARGKYIAILDSDDLWLDPQKLEKQITFLEMHPNYGIIGSWIIKIDSNSKEIGRIEFNTDNRSIRKYILWKHQFAHSSVVFLKQAALDVNKYDISYSIADDFDFILAIGKKYKFANLAEYAAAYRVHNKSLTTTKRAQHVREHLAIVKKYRHDYPGYWLALLKSYARILLVYLK